MSFPRVLHVGFEPIGSATNTGLTLASMFGGWPRSEMFELYLICGQTGGSAGKNALVASPWAAPLDAAARKIVGSRIPSPASDGMNDSIRGRSEALPLRYRLRASAAALNEAGPVIARGAWLEPVRQFRPHVIHSLLGTVRITKFVAALAARLDVPVVPHFMDDWMENLFADGQVMGVPRRQLERALARVLDRAPLVLAIGTDMKEEFETRFDRPCEVVGNSVDFDVFARLERVRISGVTPTFTYMGGLHLGRDRALSAVAASIDRRRGIAPAKLVIHAPANDAARLAALTDQFPDVVERGGTLPPNEVPGRLVASDVLVFVESARPEIHAFTRLSVSTKVPEYLAAGRPVLVVGPRQQASVRALMSGPASRFASADDPRSMDDAVAALHAMAALPIPPVDPSLLDLFDRRRTQARIRHALETAGDGVVR